MADETAHNGVYCLGAILCLIEPLPHVFLFLRSYNTSQIFFFIISQGKPRFIYLFQAFVSYEIKPYLPPQVQRAASNPHPQSREHVAFFLLGYLRCSMAVNELGLRESRQTQMLDSPTAHSKEHGL